MKLQYTLLLLTLYKHSLRLNLLVEIPQKQQKNHDSPCLVHIFKVSGYENVKWNSQKVYKEREKRNTLPLDKYDNAKDILKVEKEINAFSTC